jgi:hypothetical protein
MDGERVTALTSCGIARSTSIANLTSTPFPRGAMVFTVPILYPIWVTGLPTYSPTLSDIIAQNCAALVSVGLPHDVAHDAASTATTTAADTDP